MDQLPLISVIIPVSPTEMSWRSLLKDLAPIAPSIEILIAVPPTSLMPLEYTEAASKMALQLRVIKSELGRARQMNAAARQARAKSLWFLHADSRLPQPTLNALMKLANEPLNNLYYLDLAYQADGPLLTHLNAVGAFIRSRCFGLPFGDQGFFMSRDIFESLGGFPEECECGEDHLLVWKAKRAPVKILPIRAQILTSARKYEKHGWLKTTLRHAGLFTTQVMQEVFAGFKAKGV